MLQALLILVIPGYLRHALRSNRPDLPVTDANGQFIASGATGALVHSQPRDDHESMPQLRYFLDH